MKKLMIFAALAGLMTACGGNNASDPDEITVACYYFANYHTVPEISLSYLYLWALCSVFLGLALYRRCGGNTVIG